MTRSSGTARTLTVGALATGLLLGACAGDGGGPAVRTSDDVVDAIVETLSASFTATQALQLDVDPDTIRNIAELDDSFDPDADPDLDRFLAQLDTYLEASRDDRSSFSRAEDGSFRLWSTSDDATVWDLRASLRDAFSAQTLTPEAAVLLAVDLDRVLATVTSMFPASGDDDLDMRVPSADELRAQAQAFLPPGPLGDVGRAILDGRFGGVTGTLDLGAFGVTQTDLDQFRAERDRFGEVFGPDAFRDLYTAGVAADDIRGEDGRTVVSVDLRPRDFVEGMIAFFEEHRDLIESEGGEDLPEDLAADFETQFGVAVQDVPESIDDVAELWFDGDGHLTHVEVDLIGLAARVLAVVPDVPTEVDQVLAELEDATALLTVDLSDFGTVETVMDVEDATTIEWDDLQGVFTSWPH